VQLCTEAPLL